VFLLVSPLSKVDGSEDRPDVSGSITYTAAKHQPERNAHRRPAASGKRQAASGKRQAASFHDK
jgi:hypothetical protein